MLSGGPRCVKAPSPALHPHAGPRLQCICHTCPCVCLLGQVRLEVSTVTTYAESVNVFNAIVQVNERKEERKTYTSNQACVKRALASTALVNRAGAEVHSQQYGASMAGGPATRALACL